MSLEEYRGAAWAMQQFMRMAAEEQREKRMVRLVEGSAMRTWRIRFWNWLARLSQRRLIRLTMRQSRHWRAEQRFKRFQERWEADRQKRA